jgi:hypothetical protein
MKLNEIAFDPEADLPIIVDIVRRKLAAGEIINIKGDPRDPDRISRLDRIDDPKPWNGYTDVDVHWWRVVDGQKLPPRFNFNPTISRIERSKLVKQADGTWLFDIPPN